MGKRGGGGKGSRGAKAGGAGDGAAGAQARPGRRGPGLLDRLTWLVLVAFLVLLVVAHG